MNSPESKSSLPTWLFIATDVALIGAAAFIAFRSAQPLSSGAMLAIVGCVSLGAIVGLVPLVARFERQKNEALDDRQRALEALARTVSSSAEQISIATGSLNEIAELSQKNLRHAEHLPHKLQEKIAEFQSHLAETNDAEKEELEKELTELRASESERLEVIATKIAKSAADWAKLESASAQHLAAVTEAVAKLPASTASAITQAQNTADHALAEARIAAAKTMAEAESNATRAIALAQATGLTAITTKLAELETHLAAKLAELETHFAATTLTAVDRSSSELRTTVSSVTGGLDDKIALLAALAQKLESLAAALPAAPAVSVVPTASIAPVVQAVGETPPSTEPAPPPATTAAIAEPAASAPPDEVAPPIPKRQRRARREETSVTEPTPAPVTEPIPAPVIEPISSPVTEPIPAPVTEPISALVIEPPSSVADTAVVAWPEPTIEPAVGVEPLVAPTFIEEPAPILVEKIAEVSPAAPNTAEPFAEEVEREPTEPAAAMSAPSITPATLEPTARPIATEPILPPHPPRKRAARKPEPEPEPLLDLPLEDTSAGAPPDHVERTFSSDGATRLLATAYIGIGNRLFIRGEGPGLSWEKGVPLQFVSIGKWRWETNDASAPIRVKLYKNDEQECTALGEQTLEPGHLQEMTAAF